MSFDLQSVFDENLDLYEILGFEEGEQRDNLTTAIIKKQYRSLALIYHPDKQPDNPESLHRFHLISLATHVLTDKPLRYAYDLWLQRATRNKGEHDEYRAELINRLKKKESEAAVVIPTDSAPNVYKIQEYGEMLRKLKHFKMPYGDWRQPQTTSAKENRQLNRHRLYDSCTLRLELTNDGLLSDKQVLSDHLRSVFEGPALHDIYYSSRNDFIADATIVAYAVFDSPQQSQEVFQRWNENLGKSNWGLIIDIAPRIPVHYYVDFTKQTELSPKISEMLANQPIMID